MPAGRRRSGQRSQRQVAGGADQRAAQRVDRRCGRGEGPLPGSLWRRRTISDSISADVNETCTHRSPLPHKFRVAEKI
ncbi:hypothetical protein ATKI12_8521 [Kitasatospora sp. Ki12]